MNMIGKPISNDKNTGTTLEQPSEVTTAIRKGWQPVEADSLRRREREGIEQLEYGAMKERELLQQCDKVLEVLDGATAPLTFSEITRCGEKPDMDDFKVRIWRRAILRLIADGKVWADDSKPQRIQRVKP
jgi:hypothetical protein